MKTTVVDGLFPGPRNRAMSPDGVSENHRS